MAVARIQYSEYTFTAPSPPSLQLYNSIKNTNESSYRNEIYSVIKNEDRNFDFKRLIIWPFKIAWKLMLSFFLMMFIFAKQDSWITELIKVTFPFLMPITIVVLFLTVLSGVPYSYMSFRKYLRVKKKYYLKLKKNIDNSNNYEGYLKKFSER